MFNTIILEKGEAVLTRQEYKKFSEGDTIVGENSFPQEIKRWDISQKAEAEKALSELRCDYDRHNDGSRPYKITEYALDYCEYDDDGEFVSGSDYDFAEEKR